MSATGEQRAARVAAGLCADCTNDPEPGALRCARHLAMHAARVHRSYVRRQSGAVRVGRRGRPCVVDSVRAAGFVALYCDEGLSVREIAARDGVGHGVVLARLHEAGVRLRTPGRPPQWAPRALAEDARRLGVRRAAEAAGCSVATVYKARREAGLGRKRGGA